MTIKSIEEQIAVIQDAGTKANVSRESAIVFLKEAGIIGNDSHAANEFALHSNTVSRKTRLTAPHPSSGNRKGDKTKSK